MFQRVIVPLDGSELAERALPQAAELARLARASLHLVRVIDVSRLERYGAYGLALEYAALGQVVAEEEAAARQYLDEVAARLTAEGLTVTTEIRQGLVGRELVALAGPSDLIVMASHGRGGLARWFLGSVAEEVTRRAAGPVMLVRSQPPTPAGSPPVAD